MSIKIYFRFMVLLLSLRFVLGSGVFELEILKLELVQKNHLAGVKTSKYTDQSVSLGSKSSSQQSTIINQHDDNNNKNLDKQNHQLSNISTKTRANLHQDSKSDLIRVLVCLKEPYTTQVGRPCPYGNASILLRPDQDLKGDSGVHLQFEQPQATNLSASQRTTIINSNASSPSSSSTSQLPSNLVRINFTFRWTVSRIRSSQMR